MIRVFYIKADRDDDELVDFNEWLLFFAGISRSGNKGLVNLQIRLQAAFELYDHSDDQYIDQKELSEMIRDAVRR